MFNLPHKRVAPAHAFPVKFKVKAHPRHGQMAHFTGHYVTVVTNAFNKINRKLHPYRGRAKGGAIITIHAPPAR